MFRLVANEDVNLWTELAISLRRVQNEGGKGPIFSDPAFTEHLWWSGNGRLKREHVLDNFSQHTSKCKSCQKVGSFLSRLRES